MIIKICGIKKTEDAIIAIEAGADLLGFNFYPPSSRYIAPEDCAKIVARIKVSGKTVGSVGVFVNEPLDNIKAIIVQCNLDLVQLCGDEPEEEMSILGQLAFKAVRPKSLEEGDDLMRRFARKNAPTLLVDAYKKGAYGGTGETGDWTIANHLARQAPILLAGGLNPENVAEAVAAVNPWGVDVASGVESSPGVKHASKILAFMAAARSGQAKGYPNA